MKYAAHAWTGGLTRRKTIRTPEVGRWGGDTRDVATVSVAFWRNPCRLRRGRRHERRDPTRHTRGTPICRALRSRHRRPGAATPNPARPAAPVPRVRAYPRLGPPAR